MPQTTEKPSTFKTWYDEHGEDLNASRRDKYANDPDTQKKARESAADYRDRRASGEKIETVRTRVVKGKTVEVFTSGYVADRVGVSSQSIVNWSQRGWIPPCLFNEKHRLYTKHQIAQIRRIARSTRDAKNPRFKKMLADIQSNWRN